MKSFHQNLCNKLLNICQPSLSPSDRRRGAPERLRWAEIGICQSGRRWTVCSWMPVFKSERPTRLRRSGVFDYGPKPVGHSYPGSQFNLVELKWKAWKAIGVSLRVPYTFSVSPSKGLKVCQMLRRSLAFGARSHASNT